MVLGFARFVLFFVLLVAALAVALPAIVLGATAAVAPGVITGFYLTAQ